MSRLWIDHHLSVWVIPSLCDEIRDVRVRRTAPDVVVTRFNR